MAPGLLSAGSCCAQSNLMLTGRPRGQFLLDAFTWRMDYVAGTATPTGAVCFILELRLHTGTLLGC